MFSGAVSCVCVIYFAFSGASIILGGKVIEVGKVVERQDGLWSCVSKAIAICILI